MKALINIFLACILVTSMSIGVFADTPNTEVTSNVDSSDLLQEIYDQYEQVYRYDMGTEIIDGLTLEKEFVTGEDMSGIGRNAKSQACGVSVHTWKAGSIVKAKIMFRGCFTYDGISASANVNDFVFQSSNVASDIFISNVDYNTTSGSKSTATAKYTLIWDSNLFVHRTSIKVTCTKDGKVEYFDKTSSV